ncbi:hypothetical protein B0T25DRAFT_142793 [Lasiosphaeria hispida]|uniref:Uncharacterized protein n=1 Tax=Lasiosphaeria hispida TaxID=260671 RepID=A0AAJ0HL90_9PEZI|nr:hypothetical protein B0T25DRAFT_142793 [Lasiosphaeria hispida]
MRSLLRSPKKLFKRRAATSPAPSTIQLTEPQSPEQGGVEHRPKASPSIATELCASPSPSAADAPATQLNIYAGATDHHQPAAASQAAPGFPIKNVITPDPDPLAAVRYACIYWVDHLCDWQRNDNIKHADVFQDGGVINDFLGQHYLHWLEALSLHRSMSQGVFAMAKLGSFLHQRTTTSQLLSLVYDMRRFALYCRWVVENHPLQVYTSALVFSPARSRTRDLFQREELRRIIARPAIEDG